MRNFPNFNAMEERTERAYAWRMVMKKEGRTTSLCKTEGEEDRRSTYISILVRIECTFTLGPSSFHHLSSHYHHRFKR
jgi:hypothetical protein